MLLYERKGFLLSVRLLGGRDVQSECTALARRGATPDEHPLVQWVRDRVNESVARRVTPACLPAPECLLSCLLLPAPPGAPTPLGERRSLMWQMCEMHHSRGPQPTSLLAAALQCARCPARDLRFVTVAGTPPCRRSPALGAHIAASRTKWRNATAWALAPRCTPCAQAWPGVSCAGWRTRACGLSARSNPLAAFPRHEYTR